MSQELFNSTKQPSKHILDISSQEIIRVVSDWLENNNLGNVLPKLPDFEVSTSNWYVDICLNSSQKDKKLKVVGQVVINKNSGEIVAHTPIDNLLKNISEKKNVISNQEQKQFLELWREEQKWIDEHRKEYIGQWVAVKGSKLISHNHNAKLVFEEVNKSRIKHPLVVLVEAEKELPAGGW